MRKSMPLALISASAFGSIGPGSGGWHHNGESSGQPSHCDALKTVKRFQEGDRLRRPRRSRWRAVSHRRG